VPLAEESGTVDFNRLIGEVGKEDLIDYEIIIIDSREQFRFSEILCKL